MLIKAKYGFLNRGIDVTNIVKNRFIKSDGDILISQQTNFNQLFGDPYPGLPKELVIEMNNGLTHVIGEYDVKDKELIIRHDSLVHNSRPKPGPHRRIVDSFMLGNEIELLKLRIKYFHDVVDYFVIAESERTHQNQPKKLIVPEILANPPDWLNPNKIVGVVLTGEEIDQNGLGQTGITEHGSQKMAWGIENQQREILTRGYDTLANRGLIGDLDLIVLSDLDEFPDRELLKFVSRHYQLRVLFHQDNHYYSFKWLNQKRLYGSLLFQYWDYRKQIFPKLQQLRDLRYGYSRIRLIGGWHCSYFGGLGQVTEKLKNIVEGPAFYQECQKVADRTVDDIQTKIASGQDLYGRKSEQLISNQDWTRLPDFAFDIEPELKDYLIDLREYQRILIFDAVASRGHVFKDIRESLFEVLTKRGYSVKTVTGLEVDQDSDDRKPDLYLILGLHALVDEQLPKHFIAYQLEQLPHSPLVSEQYLTNLKRATRIWDYSQTNIGWLRERGIEAVYCPVGYSPGLEFDRNLIRDPSAKKAVVFYGSLNPRRTQMIETLRINEIPIEIYKNTCWGPERAQLMAEVPMVINWHYFDDGLMELSRLAPLLSNRVLVISEKANESEINLLLKEAVVLVDGLDELVTKVKYYLAHPDEGRKVADRGYQIFKEKFDLSKRLPIVPDHLISGSIVSDNLS